MNSANNTSECQQALEALHESEERIKAIVNTTADAIIVIDGTGSIEHFNLAAERMFGYSVSETIGKNVSMLMPSPHREQHDAYLARYLRTGEPHIIGMRRELEGQRKDGALFPLELEVSRVDHRECFTATIHDLSVHRALEQQLLSIAEQTQRQIGQSLHDDVGQELTGMALKLGSLRKYCADSSSPERQLLDDIIVGLNRTRQKLRTLSHGLIPVEVDALGLSHALHELAADINRLDGIHCRFTCCEGAPQVWGNQVASQLFHIAKEAVNNAVQHSKAKNIDIVLEVENKQISLFIKDDGCGIPASGQRDQRGMGLPIMKYRAGVIGGHCVIEAMETGGTQVACQVWDKP
jgi:two-component system CheB/CheR fusion protein